MGTMKTNWETKLLYAVIGGLLVWVFLRSCNKPEVLYVPKSSDTIIYKDNTVYVDTGSVKEIHYTVGPKHEITFDDSVDIWYSFQYPNYAQDSVILTDSTGKVVFRGQIEDTLSKNRITWRRFTGTIDRPYMTVNNIFEPVVNYRHVSGGLSAATDGKASILFVDGEYRDLLGNSFELGYGPQGKVIKIGYKRDLFRFK